ncbi:YqjK-like family protein [Sulfuriferula thiophila]|uniref:YqjK-like family protein n=1 Tax=Sulfuriferula thiophila TaxID=1781211 RepID=UPI000F60EE23|nr:YqjK-like family protein [Sulfuriferula thiophila]
MSKKLVLLTERRERLVALAAAQRVMLAATIEPWRIPLTRVDQGLTLLRYLKHHPVWLIGSGLALATLRPIYLGKWLGRGWVAWKLLRKLHDK